MCGYVSVDASTYASEAAVHTETHEQLYQNKHETPFSTSLPPGYGSSYFDKLWTAGMYVYVYSIWGW